MTSPRRTPEQRIFRSYFKARQTAALAACRALLDVKYSCLSALIPVAISSSSEIIVTYNKDDFAGVAGFGIRVQTALEFLGEIGEL